MFIRVHNKIMKLGKLDPPPTSFTTLSKKKIKIKIWHVTCDMWHFPSHFSWQSGGANHLMICYQQDLLRIVFFLSIKKQKQKVKTINTSAREITYKLCFNISFHSDPLQKMSSKTILNLKNLNQNILVAIAP